MSAAIAVGTQNVGIVCADTRFNLHAADGHVERRDTGAMQLQFRDGSVRTIPATNRKIRRFEWGWAAATGGSHLLNEEIFEALKDVHITSSADVRAHARKVCEERAHAIRAEFTNAPAHDRVGILFVMQRSERFVVGRFILGLSIDDSADSDYAFAGPPETPLDVASWADAQLASMLVNPSDLAGMFHNARVIGRVMNRVHAETESVSDHMELACLARTVEGATVEFRLNALSSQMAQASDLEIHAQLTRTR